MSSVQWIVLAIIQGITEFLPISSSAHLILPSQILGWPDQGLAFDVAVHIGSLLAVVAYFWKTLVSIAQHWLLSLVKKPHEETEARLGWWIIIATLPAVAFGYVFEDFIETHLRSVLVIATTTIVFGLLLWWADRHAGESQSLKSMTLKSVLVIGFAQALALIPGTSRSGITMTAALMMGLNRVDSARFSFLLSIPLILAAGTLKSYDLVQNPEAFDLTAMAYGTVLSFVSALACIVLFLKWIERSGFLPFVIYRLVLGAALFLLYFFA